MKNLFSTCLDRQTKQPGTFLDQEDPGTTIHEIYEPPFKFKIASALKIVDLGLKFYAEPYRKQKYIFPRINLRFLSTKTSHTPLLYYPSSRPEQSLIMVYCHGSGSNLNHVYNFATSIHKKYHIAVAAYDYTGDGESEMKFTSFEDDLKLVLAWVINKGYKLSNTIICGFSLGSYSALAIQGQMPRLLISPICGVLSFLDGEARRFNGERYGTVEHAIKLQSKALILHCSEELVHISHGRFLEQALKTNSREEVIFHEITDPTYEHRSAPSFLYSPQGEQIMTTFLNSLKKAPPKSEIDLTTFQLKEQLLDIVFYHCQHPSLAHLKHDKDIKETQ